MNQQRTSKWQAGLSAPMFSGLLYAFVTLTILVFIFSLVLAGTSMKEQSLSTVIYIIHGIALFFGGMTTGRKKGSKGWYYGGLLGIIYWIIVALIGFLGLDASLNMQAFFTLAVCFFAGALGGIIGVNMKSHR